MQRLLEDENLKELFELLVLDISDRRAPDNIGNFDIVNAWLATNHIAECFVTLLLKRPAIVYLNVSQGTWGYIRDLGFMIPASLMRRKIVVHLRGSEFGAFYQAMPKVLRWLTRAIFNRVSRVIVLGHTLKRVFDGLVDDGRIVVIPNGINYTQFGRLEKGTIAKNGPRILYLSSLRRRKGLLRVIEALPGILARHPEARITFAGEWQDIRDKRDAMALIERNRLTEHVTFTGEVTGPDKIRLYQQHDVFVFTPIEPEGLPWVILEAMSAGLPVVTSDQGAIAEVVQHGHTGFLIEPEPKHIAAKVCHLLEHVTEARSMGFNGRQRVEQFFSEAAYLKAMHRVFCDALNS
jgi:glycosyltransferase involved in cell wall biosynthesis